MRILTFGSSDSIGFFGCVGCTVAILRGILLSRRLTLLVWFFSLVLSLKIEFVSHLNLRYLHWENSSPNVIISNPDNPMKMFIQPFLEKLVKLPYSHTVNLNHSYVFLAIMIANRMSQVQC